MKITIQTPFTSLAATAREKKALLNKIKLRAVYEKLNAAAGPRGDRIPAKFAKLRAWKAANPGFPLAKLASLKKQMASILAEEKTKTKTKTAAKPAAKPAGATAKKVVKTVPRGTSAVTNAVKSIGNATGAKFLAEVKDGKTSYKGQVSERMAQAMRTSRNKHADHTRLGFGKYQHADGHKVTITAEGDKHFVRVHD